MRQDLQDRFSTLSWASIAGAESRSGSGSSLAYTEKLRTALPILFRSFNVKRFVDAPCGDWNWMRKVDLSGLDYIGLDIVEDIIVENQTRYASPNIQFGVADITSDPLPPGDLLMVRDCLFHLDNEMAWAFLRNFAASEIPFLLTTSYTLPVNHDTRNGGFRQLNLRAAPFNFERHIIAMNEPKEWWANFSNRYMGVWSRTQVEDALRRAGHGTA